MKADATTATETWRDWTADDVKKQPRRICSVAGCRSAPARVKETTLTRNDGSTVQRKHVYCALHLPAA